MLTRLLLILLFTGLVSAQTVQQNFRIFPGTITQSEPIIAIDKATPPLFFASAVTINTANGFKSEGVYVSTDGGLNWFGSDTCKGSFLSNHGGDPGIVITPSQRLILTHMGSVFPGVYSHYSDNLGLTWSNAYTITNQQTDDKGTTFIDDNINSPYFGRIYSAFVKLISPYPVFISYSDDNGESWSVPTVINNSPPARCIGPGFVINENGKIFACWSILNSQPPYHEDYVSFASSTDGGNTWNIFDFVFDTNGILGALAAKGGIRVNGLPRIAIDKSNSIRNGWIYIVTTDKNISPAGSDPDIIFHRSTDSGLTWSTGVRVNQDDFDNGKIQYFPAIDVDKNGTINVIYYDDRNTSSDSAEVFISRSTDGGNSWTDELLSDHRFKPKPVFGGSSNYQGDYISLIFNANKLYAYWMDDYSGIYQVWTKITDIATEVDDEQTKIVNEFYISNNFPNPFNPLTAITYRIPDRAKVQLKIYDILGNEITTLVDENKEPGSYTIEFNSEKYGLPSGVYIYSFKTNEFNHSRKMILLK